jgi:ribose 5-phosphate isomerase B
MLNLQATMEAPMKLAFAADHAGVELKNALLAQARAARHDVVDLGGHDPRAADDYPEYAARAAEALRDGRAERAVIVCGSGVGVCIAANKHAGVRAGLCHDTYSAHQGVEHDDMNTLCLGARIVGSALAGEILGAFLGAAFSREERHVRRVALVRALDSTSR